MSIDSQQVSHAGLGMGEIKRPPPPPVRVCPQRVYIPLRKCFGLPRIVGKAIREVFPGETSKGEREAE